MACCPVPIPADRWIWPEGLPILQLLKLSKRLEFSSLLYPLPSARVTRLTESQRSDKGIDDGRSISRPGCRTWIMGKGRAFLFALQQRGGCRAAITIWSYLDKIRI